MNPNINVVKMVVAASYLLLIYGLVTSNDALAEQPCSCNKTTIVSATVNAWQVTGSNVEAGDIVNIVVIGGQWTGKVRGDKHTRADAYHTGEGPRFNKAWATPNYPVGAFENTLVGMQGASKFYVGNSFRYKASKSGPLYLRMNDPGVHDNDGELTVQIKIER